MYDLLEAMGEPLDMRWLVDKRRPEYGAPIIPVMMLAAGATATMPLADGIKLAPEAIVPGFNEGF